MKPYIKKYLKDLERHILTLGSEEILNEYRSHINSILVQQLNIDHALDGFATVQLLHAVRNSLQHIASVYESHAIAPIIWNRFMAATLQAVIDTVSSSPTDPRQGLKVPGSKKTVARNSLAKKTEDATRTPRLVESKPSVSRPEDQPPTPPAISTDEIRRQVETTLAQHKKNPFFNSPSVRCRDPLCTFCITAAKHVPITKCSDRTSHGKGKCHKTGYWPHVGATLWAKWKHPHNAGASFSLTSPLKLPDGALPPINAPEANTDIPPTPTGTSDGLTSMDEDSQQSGSSAPLQPGELWSEVCKPGKKRARHSSSIERKRTLYSGVLCSSDED